jgi:hypothetical protein
MDAMTVPAEVIPLTATLKVVPLPVTTAVFVPPAVPLVVTSPVANPVTDSLKTTVKLTGEALVGSAWAAAWLIVTEGRVVSGGGGVDGWLAASPG